MIPLGLMLLFFLQAAAPAPDAGVPAEPGVYLHQVDTGWVRLSPAEISGADARGVRLFVYTGGYTDTGMRLTCPGPAAAVRLSARKPTLYLREAGTVEDALIVRLRKKKDSRVLTTSFSNVTVGNKGGFDRKDVFRLRRLEHADGAYSVSPEKDLPPGEYLLVFGDALPAYDFGIDRAR